MHGSMVGHAWWFFFEAYRNLTHEYEIWLDNDSVDTPDHNTEPKHTAYLDGCDHRGRIVCASYGGYYGHGNTNVYGGKHRDRYETTMVRKTT